MQDYTQIFKGHDVFGQIARRWINIHMEKKFNKNISVDDVIGETSIHNHYTVSLYKENSMLNEHEYTYAEALVKLINNRIITIEEMRDELKIKV